MNWLFLLLRLGALGVSILGYAGFSRAFLGVPTYYSYLVSLSTIGCAMYFAGLLGVFNSAVLVILGLGFLLLGVVILNHRFNIAFRRPTLNMINVLFILWFCLAFASLINYRLIHYDNFSHWALVVKQMLITDAFPDAASQLIDFKNYPLGVSSFLYYVCKVVGTGENVMLVGQLLLIFACFYAFNGVIRDNKRFLLPAIIGLTGAVMSFFNISVGVNNLLTDFLLPLYALAIIAGVTESGKSYLTACLASIPVLGMLLIVKNTGILFAVPAFLYLLYAGRVVRKGRPLGEKLQAWLFGLIAIAASLIPLILWNMHTARVFAGVESKFVVDVSALLSLDVNNLAALVPDKSLADIHGIISLFVQTVTDPYQLATQGILFVNIIAVVIWLNARLGFRMRWRLLPVLVLMDTLMLVYYAGILVFYLVVMPRDEALRLAGFERYASSMVIFMIGAIGLCITRDVEHSLHVQQGEFRDYRAFKSLHSKRVYQLATLAVFSLAMLLLTTSLQGMNNLQETYPSTLPARAETILGNQWEGFDDRRYLLYAPDTDNQVTDKYLFYIARYLLFAPEADTTSIADERLLETITEYDYFVIVEADASIQSFMMQQTGLNGEAGIYSIPHAFGDGISAEQSPSAAMDTIELDAHTLL